MPDDLDALLNDTDESPETLEEAAPEAPVKKPAAKKNRQRADKAVSGTKGPAPIPEGAEVITVHFVEDGFTALGRLFYRGEDISLVPDSDDYLKTVDRNGDSWLDLADDDAEQFKRYGRVMFRSGSWPHEVFDEAAYAEVMASGNQQERERAKKAKQRAAAPGMKMLTK